MENLLTLLNKISEVSPIGVFSQEVIIVQNAGMQHWLNLEIANKRGISMNMRYALPAQYLWQLIRTLASEDKVPEQSPYSREVLTWRIYALLATESVINDECFTPATQYWFEQATTESVQGSTTKTSSKADFKRYQLAGQMADLYEQYLIFRPNWLDAWQRDEEIIKLSEENKWQAKLWQLLINQLPYNPVELLNDAINNIADKLAKDPNILPKRMSFFGINTMAPMWLNFINALSEFIDVDFFHLNPCFSYWGDIISEKQAINKLSHWSNDADSDEHLFVGNPLLANFGQQGREFLALLQDYSTVNIELFVKAHSDGKDQNEDSTASVCILHQLQNDILALRDASEKVDAVKQDEVIDEPVTLIDDSITIVSCHSALREVQALHDYLLHQFNDTANDKDKLTPKDVLVMCPQIEQYAPYVNAVFTRGWQDLTDEVPPLPCSIADRSAKDSDPLIAAFSELLTLPDSRFQVSQLLSFIRLPAVANKFAINAEDSEKISLWLQQATIHWGIDQAHKKVLLGEQASNNFTWQQGLSRLLQGYAYSDADSIYQNQLLLGVVEGDDAILLGQLMLFIEQLQHLSHQLNTARTAKSWQSFLLSQIQLLFSTRVAFSTNTTKKAELQATLQTNNQIDNSIAIIEQAIASLVEYCEHAHFDEEVALPIIVDFLNNHFSQGDASKQFMVGQVTFCSMLPMRSIPFKVIAVLGLNDGEFPRQRPALGFDLIAQNKAVLGDRSRRGDDRYLFLEALISARKALYLSYQGRNIRNNREKEPSLVLKELMDYLAQGYGWQFKQNNSDVHQMAMQPYSEDNYIVRNTKSDFKPSFDANWLALGQNEHEVKEAELVVEPCDIADNISTIDATDLIRFFQHPSKIFAQQVLNLYLDSREVSLDDVEPFTADHLENYLLKQDLLAASLAAKNSPTIEQVINSATLSGKFPDLPSTELHFDEALEASSQLAEEIIDQGCDNPELIDCQIVLSNTYNSDHNSTEQSITLNAKLPVKVTHSGVQLVFYRSSTAKPKDLFTLYLHHLILQVWQQQNSKLMHDDSSSSYLLGLVEQTRGFYFNTKAQKVEQYSVSNDSAEEAKAELERLLIIYSKGQKQVLMLNGDLAAQVFKESRGKRVELTQEGFEKFWQDSPMPTGTIPGFGSDAYIHYFWPQCPDIDSLAPEIESVYQGLYRCVIKEKSNKNTVKVTPGASR
jgi:exodeoxyribonuclease V gamma subunit